MVDFINDENNFCFQETGMSTKHGPKPNLLDILCLVHWQYLATKLTAQILFCSHREDLCHRDATSDQHYLGVFLELESADVILLGSCMFFPPQLFPPLFLGLDLAIGDFLCVLVQQWFHFSLEPALESTVWYSAKDQLPRFCLYLFSSTGWWLSSMWRTGYPVQQESLQLAKGVSSPTFFCLILGDLFWMQHQFFLWEYY